MEAGSAALNAKDRKAKKYASLAPYYKFVTLDLETCGNWGPEATALISSTGRRLCSQTVEKGQPVF